jgi:ParB family chromosome partitioning protein
VSTTPSPPIKANGAADREQFQVLPIEWLRPSKTNPRKHFGDLAELTASIQAHGILVPLIVRPTNPLNTKDSLYEIVAGERRYRASKEAGLRELPVRIVELDDKQALEVQVIENLQRADVHPIEEADGYQQLIAKHGYDVAALAVRVGKSESYVYQRLKLAALIPKAKQAFYEEKITASHAVLIARLDEKQQKQALEYAACPTHPPSVRDFQEWVHEEFYLDLHAAPWKKDDAGLVPAAGACVNCPKRSGFTPALFPELAKGKDLCQDAKCYRGKQSAFIHRALDENPELKPIAVGHIQPGERNALEKDFGTRLVTIQNWEIQRGKKKPADAQQGIVVEPGYGDGRVGELVWFAKEKPAGESAWDKRSKAAARRAELESQRKQYEREQLGLAIVDAVPPVPAERELRIAARAFFLDLWGEIEKKILTRHGMQAGVGYREKAITTRLETWGQAELTRFLIELAIAKQVHSNYADPRDLHRVAEAYKLNPKAVMSAAGAEWKRQQKTKEKSKKQKAKKPAAAAKKKPAKSKSTASRAPVAAVARLVHQLHTEGDAKKGGPRAKAKAAAATA